MSRSGPGTGATSGGGGEESPGSCYSSSRGLSVGAAPSSLATRPSCWAGDEERVTLAFFDLCMSPVEGTCLLLG